MISATSIDKTAQLLMDNWQDLHFDNEYKIFAMKIFQLKLVKSFPMPLCVSTTDTLCHWNIVRFYRTERCKQGTSDNATTESDYIVFILQRNGSISTTSRHGNHHTFTRRIARWQRRSPFSCLRLRQWPVTYLITLSDWIMSCQPGRHAVVTVCEPDWKHKWAAYKSFDETSSFNNL